MKASIIVFSPSGNTGRTSKLLKSYLEQNDISTQLINITGNERYFLANDKQRFLEETISEHDILFIGSPVYAHHLQYHVQDLIKNLPYPLGKWGKVAIPFVTYGGIQSGIALEEAGKLLRESGRKVLAGMKVSDSHRMTRVFMEDEYNKGQPEDKKNSVIKELVNRVRLTHLDSLKDQSKYLKYQSLKTTLKSNIIFKEKVWHQKRYPKVVINEEECIKCGKCKNVCPVCHLQQDSNRCIIKNPASSCIHCFNCIAECPKNAISPVGDLNKAKNFINKMAKNAKENPSTSLYPNR